MAPGMAFFLIPLQGNCWKTYEGSYGYIYIYYKPSLGGFREARAVSLQIDKLARCFSMDTSRMGSMDLWWLAGHLPKNIMGIPGSRTKLQTIN